MGGVVRFLVRTGIRRGFVGGSRAWAAVGGVAIVLRALSRLASPKPEAVFCEQLAPGESMLITRQAVPSGRRRQRKQARGGSSGRS